VPPKILSSLRRGVGGKIPFTTCGPLRAAFVPAMERSPHAWMVRYWLEDGVTVYMYTPVNVIFGKVRFERELIKSYGEMVSTRVNALTAGSKQMREVPLALPPATC